MTVLVDEGDRLPVRQQIDELEAAMLDMPQVDIEVTHHFSHGIYAREILIPAGVTLTGKIHKTEHLNILSKGRITVVTDEGNKTIDAPATIVCPANTKRAGYAHTDCVWVTIHGTNETDLVKLEEELISPDYLSIKDTKVIK